MLAPGRRTRHARCWSGPSSCAIFSQNLDEFFQVRVAGPEGAGRRRASAAAPRRPRPRRAAPRDRRAGRASWSAAQERRCSSTRSCRRSPTHGIALRRLGRPGRRRPQAARRGVRASRSSPSSPRSAVDPGHPFPYISNLSLNLAVIGPRPEHDERALRPGEGAAAAAPVRACCPTASASCRSSRSSPPTSTRCSPGMEVDDHWPFRVTRNADLDLEEEEADDLLAAIEMELRRRRFGRAVRLEIDAGMIERGARAARARARPDRRGRLRASTGPLDLAGLWALLRARPARPQGRRRGVPVTQPAGRADEDERRRHLRACCAGGDVLVHHPYDSLRDLGRGVHRAGGRRPDVLAIKQTLYRTVGRQPDRRRADPGGRAGQAGGGRWSSSRPASTSRPTSTWARALEEAGVHVVYGLVGLKTHAKVALVVREEPDGIRRYCHIGTGNYNPQDRAPLRGHRPAHRRPRPRRRPHRPVQLPHRLQPRGRLPQAARRPRRPARAGSSTLIARRGGAGRGRPHHDEDEQPGRPRADRGALRRVQARRADRPHRPRHLLPAPGGAGAVREHPRAVASSAASSSTRGSTASRNGAGPGRPEYFIGSADLMPRNLDRRVEALVPVVVGDHQRQLDGVLATGWPRRPGAGS